MLSNVGSVGYATSYLRFSVEPYRFDRRAPGAGSVRITTTRCEADRSDQRNACAEQYQQTDVQVEVTHTTAVDDASDRIAEDDVRSRSVIDSVVVEAAR